MNTVWTRQFGLDATFQCPVPISYHLHTISYQICVQNDSGRSEYKFGIRNINHFAKQKTLNSVFFTGLVFSVRNWKAPQVGAVGMRDKHVNLVWFIRLRGGSSLYEICESWRGPGIGMRYRYEVQVVKYKVEVWGTSARYRYEVQAHEVHVRGTCTSYKYRVQVQLRGKRFN